MLYIWHSPLFVLPLQTIKEIRIVYKENGKRTERNDEAG